MVIAIKFTLDRSPKSFEQIETNLEIYYFFYRFQIWNNDQQPANHFTFNHISFLIFFLFSVFIFFVYLIMILNVCRYKTSTLCSIENIWEIH